MIECITIANSHLFGDALASQFRLRHKVFIERQGWDVPRWQNMEYDQFDTPAAHYLVWRDEDGEVRGVSRMAPTDRPYMLSEVWPDMVTLEPLPHSPRIWEGTRFGIDRDLPSELRSRVARELVLAYLEFSLALGIDSIIGVMPPPIVRRLFINVGWPVVFLGEPKQVETDRIIAGRMPVSREILERVRLKTGIMDPVLRFEPEPVRKVA